MNWQELQIIEDKKIPFIVIIDVVLVSVQIFGMLSLSMAFGEDASTGTCLVPDCSSLRLDNGTLIETAPLALGTCFDFTFNILHM
jgi:hypothetical protein